MLHGFQLLETYFLNENLSDIEVLEKIVNPLK
jgi:hypothetical protein